MEDIIDKTANIDWLKSIYHQSIIPIEIYNPEGILIDCNKACLAFFGIDSVNNVAGFNLFDDPNLTSQQIEKIRKGGKVRFEIKFDFDLVHKLKLYKSNKYGICYLDCSITSVTRGNNEIQGYLLYLSDITKRVEAEQALKEMNAAKDKLFSIIAHDLRSPFISNLALSELLERRLKESAISHCKKYVTLLNTSAKNTLNLLDNLLNWAKSQTKQINFTPEKIILSSVIWNIIETSNASATIKNISLNYSQLDAIEVYSDKNMLKIILQNLISNAIKFTKTGGHITVREKLEQNHVEITISDNGIGIKKEIIKKLFRFSTNNTSLGTENEKGSGIGLVLCKEFVKKQGGIIWAESKEGKGSDFKFTLPLNKSY